MANTQEEILKNLSTTSATAPRNNEDPSGEFPRRDYFNSFNINYAAAGGKRNDLYIGGGAEGVPLNLGTPIASEYPLNQVQETISGHVIEIDDTPGNERMLIRHRDGAGIDLRPDGTVIVSSTKNRVEISGADQTVIVEGEGNLVYKGNLNLKISGDFNVDVGGNFNVKVAGNRSENIIGSDRKTVNGNVGQIVRGGYSTTVTQQVTDTFLAGHSHNVKGTFSNNIEGDANYVSSGAGTFTSQTNISMATENLNIAAASASVFGGTGTFGGEGIVFYGKGGTFGEGVTAPTFKGNLNGKADTAALADKALGANTAGSLGSSGTANYPTHTATPTTAQPKSSNVREYLSKAAGGIRKVSIDIGNFVKNFIDKTEAYGGIASFNLTTGAARSRLRDPANLSNSTFVSTLVAENTVSQEVYRPTPTGIGRIVSGNSTPKFGQIPIGNSSGIPATDPFLPVAGRASILPDPYYNPLNQQNITSSTLLAPGIRLSKFLGGSGDAVNIDFMKDQETRKNVAKHLYYHSTIMKSIMTNKGVFANLRLVVAEGVYKPGANENVTPDSINDLRTKGRAVVYELYNTNGELALTETFDLAEYWKDTVYFDKLILSYDTFDPSGKLHAQLIITLPELDANWEGSFNRSVETTFNGNVLTQGELVEVLPQGVSPLGEVGGYTPPSGEAYSGTLGGAIAGVDTRLLSIVEQTAAMTGVSPYVTSGFRAPADNPSGRHAGFAVDVALYRNGKVLSVTDNYDLQFIEQFSREFVANTRRAGLVPSVGVANPAIDPRTGRQYPLYMNGTAFHYDIALTPGIGSKLGAGSTQYWGGSGDRSRHVPAPSWLVSLF